MLRETAAVVGLATFVGAVSGCGGGSTSPQTTTPTVSSPVASSSTHLKPTPDESVALKAAVNAYSVAYLSGNGAGAYALLSSRCKARLSETQMQSMTQQAKATYGEQPIKTLFVDNLAGDLARVTYTYSAPAINQTKEPWVREGGRWLEDDC